VLSWRRAVDTPLALDAAASRCCGWWLDRRRSSGPLLRQRVADARVAGLTFDEVVASLMALAPTIGSNGPSRPPVWRSLLDYDIDAALEHWT